MLHQDDFCQLSFQIPLNDITDTESSTCFVEGSHLSKNFILNELFGSVDKYLPNLFLKNVIKNIKQQEEIWVYFLIKLSMELT